MKSCKQMSSCEEAKHQLNVCGNTKIDGNRDGVPCEALCR
ncbi:excalibur calcium-binding domain-containing protein [Pseudomonas sp. PLMAX]